VTKNLAIAPFEKRLKSHFKTLNEEWLEKYFIKATSWCRSKKRGNIKMRLQL